MKKAVTFLVFGYFFISCGPKIPDEIKTEMANLPAELDYNIHVKPILSDKCFACHGPDVAKQKAGLRLDFAKFAYADLTKNKGKVAIEPGDLEGSQLFHRIISNDPEYKMPSPDSHLSLSDYEKAILLKWIKDGAAYKPHWAFVKPEKIDLPAGENGNWVKEPIDNFVLQKLDENRLKPNPEADKYTLIRRLSFDLTGLPPTIAETDAFLNDKSGTAYEKVVDRLLKSPHYGERMAVDWLDLARFSDSHGYTVDRLRDMTPYRDWVIDAFNKNMPYNQFVKWQLAGDMMPKPTKEMLIATAFNRNHPQNLEGGIVEKEFQTEYVMDRTNTFGQAFLGLSVGCARCHDHKYDPFSQKNYYELYSFFNNVKEAGQISWDDTMPSPTMLLPTKQQEEILQFLKNNIAKEERNLSAETPKFDADFKKWLQNYGYKNLTKSSISTEGLMAKYDFEKGSMINKINKRQTGFVNSLEGKVDANFVSSNDGTGLKLSGDAWFDTDGMGAFRKSDAFSIGLWVNIDKATKEGVIFNKTIGERLYNFKGFHVYLLENGLLEMTMAHAAPSNAITKTSKLKAPKGQWIQLTMMYDGSGKSNGMHLYLNGDLLEMDTEIDQLIKDINYKNTKKQPGIMVGAWWRGNGLKNGLIDDLVIYNREITPFEIKLLANKTNWNFIANKDYHQFNNNEIEILRKYYYSANLGKNAVFQNLKNLKLVFTDSLDKVQELMIMQESKPKQAYILARGNYDSPTKKVYPNTPESLSPFPENLPKNRYGLAEWLTNKENPLAARVVVNRLWQQFFGIGLVKTTEDFGNQGEMPSNLPLLDYLAVDFKEYNWDIKRMVKAMVMSATYQQSSHFTKEMYQKDPENRLLGRGPSMRLTAEMMRDNALFAAGILKNEIGGKSIKPYQPAGLWEINNTSYKPDSSDVVYKRSMYIVVKRSVLNPTLATFDGSSRSSCELRRQKTNTPLQALVTQNDPTYLEASKILGEQMAAISDPKSAIIFSYRKLTGHIPKANELAVLLDLQQKQLAKFQANKAKSIGWQKAGFYKLNHNLDPAKIIANAVVANVIMNSDACLTKR